MADPKVFLKKTSKESPVVKALKETPEKAVSQVQNKVASKVAMNSARITRHKGVKLQVHRKPEGLLVVLTAPQRLMETAAKAYKAVVT